MHANSIVNFSFLCTQMCRKKKRYNSNKYKYFALSALVFIILEIIYKLPIDFCEFVSKSEFFADYQKQKFSRVIQQLLFLLLILVQVDFCMNKSRRLNQLIYKDNS